ncbi:hypothetical protein A2U01_0074070, partial [Trifolium medium]|nr:hypothetical protein [Trifolium medium]
FGDSSANCASRRKDGASRQQVERKVENFCHLRVAQERTARRASQLGFMHQEGSVSGASRSFIWRVAHLHCSSRAPREQVARRADAKSI